MKNLIRIGTAISSLLIVFGVLLLCFNSRGQTCSAGGGGNGFTLLMQTQNASTNGSKCGWAAFQAVDPPWVHMYLHKLDVLSVNSSTNNSSTDGSTVTSDDGCSGLADPGPSSSSSSYSLTLTRNQNWLLAVSCPFSESWSGS